MHGALVPQKDHCSGIHSCSLEHMSSLHRPPEASPVLGVSSQGRRDACSWFLQKMLSNRMHRMSILSAFSMESGRMTYRMHGNSRAGEAKEIAAWRLLRSGHTVTLLPQHQGNNPVDNHLLPLHTSTYGLVGSTLSSEAGNKMRTKVDLWRENVKVMLSVSAEGKQCKEGKCKRHLSWGHLEDIRMLSSCNRVTLRCRPWCWVCTTLCTWEIIYQSCERCRVTYCNLGRDLTTLSDICAMVDVSQPCVCNHIYSWLPSDQGGMLVSETMFKNANTVHNKAFIGTVVSLLLCTVSICYLCIFKLLHRSVTKSY